MIGVLFILVVLASYSLWCWGAKSPRQVGLSAALVTAVVLLHRPIHAALRAEALDRWLRLMAVVFVWACMGLSGYLANHPEYVVQWLGTVLLAGVTIAVGLAFYGEMVPTRVTQTAASPIGPMTRFFDQRSPLLPTALGLALSGGGAYGLLVLSNYQSADWVLYAAVAGAGIWVLKRRFSVAH